MEHSRHFIIRFLHLRHRLAVFRKLYTRNRMIHGRLGPSDTLITAIGINRGFRSYGTLVYL